VKQAQKKICKFKKKSYKPKKENTKIYDEIFALYKQLHDAFGTKNYRKSLFNIMKKLLEIKEKV